MPKPPVPGHDAADAGASAARSIQTAASPDPDIVLQAKVRVQRWQALRRRLPYITRRGSITRREAIALAQESERFFAGHDPADNASTRLPAIEQARMPVIWLAEVFTPITLPSLIPGLRDLASRQRGIGRGRR
jgi:hypothetical protein